MAVGLGEMGGEPREAAARGLLEPREASSPDPEAGEQSGQASWRRCNVSEMEQAKSRVLGQRA